MLLLSSGNVRLFLLVKVALWGCHGLESAFDCYQYSSCLFLGCSSSDWLLGGNGGMDPYDSLLRSAIVVPITHSPIPN